MSKPMPISMPMPAKTTGRTTRRRTWPSLALMALMAVAAVPAALASSPAPDFTLKSNQGDNVRLSEHRGDVILLNFWASWCGPCRQEMPILDSLNKRYSKLGFSVIGVNVDENSALADKLLKDIPVGFPVLYDNRNTVADEYKVAAMPTTVLIDRDGKVRYVHKGYTPGVEQTYEQKIRELITE